MTARSGSTRLAPRAAVTWLLTGSLALAACGAPASTSSTAPAASGIPQGPSATTLPSATALPTAASSGFAFSMDGVLGYYEGLGYTCSPSQPSTTAAGYTFRSCQTQDAGGRGLAIGIVTDPSGALADAFASVQGTAQETVLAPSDALPSLSAFLGATLGEDRGSALLMWLAGHLGDGYAETTSADLQVATYTASESDHSRLYVEIANQAYLEAPTPGPS